MSYDLPSDHREMVFDQHRNRAYGDALARVLTPESRVMDLGAGVGILGLMAARMGAGEVHLVDPAPVVHVATEIARDNDLHNVQVHRSAVEELDLEAKVDVITSVFTGNFLLGEDLLQHLFHARDRFLAPGGTLIPDRARMWVAPVSAADYYARYVDHWCQPTEGADLDLSAARRHAANTPLHDGQKAFQAECLQAARQVTELDFYSATEASCDAELTFEIGVAGTCHGWLGWFDMRLGEQWFSTAPEAAESHWSQVLLPLEQPLEVVEGDSLNLRLKRPQDGEWSWVTCSQQGEQRQSSFLSCPVTFRDLGSG